MSSPLLDLFTLASVVELHGLVSAPHHNGRKGVVCGATTERLSVQLEPLSGSETPGPLNVKPSNVRVVPDCGISLALRSLSSVVINDAVAVVQSKVGTKGYDPVEHEKLIKLQHKNMKKMTKARTHVYDDFLLSDACVAGVGRTTPRRPLYEQHCFRHCCVRHAPASRRAAQFFPQTRCQARV
jgi:hypothetical protein